MIDTHRWGLLFILSTCLTVGFSGAGAPTAQDRARAPAQDSGSGGGGNGKELPGNGGPENAPRVTQIPGDVDTALPELPQLTNVDRHAPEDSVGVDFDPVDGAVDYRIYPLPPDADITAYSDGSVTVKNAIYRCAGKRQTFNVPSNKRSVDPSTTINSNGYAWTTEIPDSPTLGYVYVTQGPGRIPVYAVAGHPSTLEVGWRESRLKVYTTDDKRRQSLLDEGWRDDGIVFYVPEKASASTRTIYGSQTAVMQAVADPWTQYQSFYFTAADKAAHATDTTPPAPAFQVLTAPAHGTKPLMAVFYQPQHNHTELAVGKERFERAAYQGNGPLWHVEWAGLTDTTILVVEALDQGCPYQGFLSPQHLSAPPHQTFLTLEQMQKAQLSGEVFINGQYEAASRPKPIARSFIQVTPRPHDPAAWDWYDGFNVGSSFGQAKEIPGCRDFSCKWFQSSQFDFAGYRIDNPNGAFVFTYGQFLGQLWEAFDDVGSDVTGKVRFTARKKGKIDPDPGKYLYATMSVGIVSTDRRYPQLLISDQDAPVNEGMANPKNNTLLVQAIHGPSMRIEVQAIHGLVNGNPWDVNNQAPAHPIIDYDNWPDPSTRAAERLGVRARGDGPDDEVRDLRLVPAALRLPRRQAGGVHAVPGRLQAERRRDVHGGRRALPRGRGRRARVRRPDPVRVHARVPVLRDEAPFRRPRLQERRPPRSGTRSGSPA